MEEIIMAKEVLTDAERFGAVAEIDESNKFDFQLEEPEETFGGVLEEPEEFDPAVIDFTVNESFKVASEELFDQVAFTDDVMSMPAEFSLETAGEDPSGVPEGEFKEDKIGFTEAFKDKAGRPMELVPFVGPMFSVSRMTGLIDTALRVQREPLPPKRGGKFGLDESPEAFAQRQVEWMRDRYVVAEWVSELEERQARGLSVGGKIAEGLLELPAFMTEFLLTAGVYEGASQGTKVAIAKVLKRSGEKVSKELAEKIAKNTGIKIATKLTGAVVGTAARTIAEFTRVAKSSLERLMPNVQITEKGEVVLQESGETPLSALVKGFGDVYIENITEISGSTITKAGSAILKRIPVLGKIDDALKTLWLGKNPNKTAVDFIKEVGTKVGYNGFIEEIGEEQLGKILRLSTGLQTIPERNEGESTADYMSRLIEGFGEELLVEAGILAPLALIGAAGKAGAARATSTEQGLRPKQGEAVTAESLASDERIKLFESEKNVRLSQEQNKAALDFLEKGIGDKTKAGKLKRVSKAGSIKDDDILNAVIEAPIDRTSETAKREVSQRIALVDSLPQEQQAKIQEESVAKVKKRISFKKPKVPIVDKLKDVVLKTDKAFRDEFAVLRKAVKLADPEGKLAPADNPVELAVAFTQKSSAKTRGFVIESTTDLAGNRKSKSMKQIFKPIMDDGGTKNVQDFVTYMVSARDIQLQKQNKETGIDPVASQIAFDALDSPRFSQAAKELTEWNQKGIDLLDESGRITAEAGEAIKVANPIYAPFFREFGEKEITTGNGKGGKFTPKRLKGSERKIVDPIEGMIQQMDAMINSAQRASIERSVANLAEGNPEALEEFIKPTESTLKEWQIKTSMNYLLYSGLLRVRSPLRWTARTSSSK
jgi:hypothetical protein